ncbi:MAG: hypothetical protein ACRD9R_21895 [Pyrinomonadaceae bacterium]
MKHSALRKAFLCALLLAASACGEPSGDEAKYVGKYTEAEGQIILELGPGGKGSLTLFGDTQPCDYTAGGKQITINCKGDKSVLTVRDDGSITGPPGTIGMTLRKSTP